MDDKTAELRDIFIDATGSDTVTERQESERGSLADETDDVETRLRDVVAAMRDRYDFATDLDDDALLAVVRGFYAGRDDDAVAADLDVDGEAVRTARFDLHLVDESDRDAPLDFAALRKRVREDGAGAATDAEIAADLGVDAEVVRRYRPVAAAEVASTRANDRFRDAFAELLTDADLEVRHAADAREDGLEDATEDIETNVSF
jgi:hypothetical protein